MEKVRIRVKTREELGGRPLNWDSSGNMDYLFGMEIDAWDYDYESFEIRNELDYQIWYVFKKDVDILPGVSDTGFRSPSTLESVLNDALVQATSGKGKERHADDNKFEEQPIMWIEKQFKSFQLGQAVKKVHESQRLDKDRAVAELLGAINYIAAHIIYLQGDNYE